MKAAFLAFDNCAIWQVSILQRLLVDAGWSMRTLTLEGTDVMTDGGIFIRSDGPIERAAPRDFQLVLITGGEPSQDALQHAGVHRFLRQYDGQRGLIAASGSALAYVAAAGLLRGLSFTTDESTRRTYAQLLAESIYDDNDVCVSGNIITSKESAHFDFTIEVLRRSNNVMDAALLARALRLSKNM